MLLPGSSSASSAFPRDKLGRLPASAREHDFPRICFRGCSYFFMFRPPRLLAPQIVPTAAHTPAGRPRLLRPSKTCVVTFARIGYAIRLTTGNWRNEDFHLARFLSLVGCSLSPQFFPQMPGPQPRRSHRVHLPVSSSVSSAFPRPLSSRLPVSSANTIFPR